MARNGIQASTPNITSVDTDSDDHAVMFTAITEFHRAAFI